VVDKTHDLEDVIDALEPVPTAPPISQMAPALRPRPRASGARLTRVSPDDENLAESAPEARSSRR
jgi:adenosine/AMP kinase